MIFRIMKKVFKSNGVWQYSEDPHEIAKGVFEDSVEYDEVLFAEISDWHISHVCLIRFKGRLGIYNLHHFRRSGAFDLVRGAVQRQTHSPMMR